MAKRLKFDPDSPKPRFRQIQDYVLGEVANGRMQPGDRLPPLRQWAGEIGVAYETMSKAIRELVEQGVLEARPRWGTRVAARGVNGRRRTGAVGVLASQAYYEFLTHSRFYGALMPAVQDELMQHQERVIHERWTPDRKMTELFDHLKLIDGLLLLGNVRYPVSQIRAVEGLGVPVVFIGGELTSPKVCIVRSDDVADTRKAVRRLVKIGHRRIALWTDARDPRHEGYTLGLADAGIHEDPKHILTRVDCERVAKRIARMDPRPTALLITRHLDRVGALAMALTELGIKPGKDLYFCAYDEDLWRTLEPLRRPYSRIEQPVREIARTAARVLLERIEDRYEGPTHTLLRSRVVSVADAR